MQLYFDIVYFATATTVLEFGTKKGVAITDVIQVSLTLGTNNLHSVSNEFRRSSN